MNTEKIVECVSCPEFYARVCFLAIKVAQTVTDEDEKLQEHDARVAYANRVFRGDDNAILLAHHVVAVSPSLQQAMTDGKNTADADIEAALVQVWTPRARAFAVNGQSAVAPAPEAPAPKIKKQ